MNKASHNSRATPITDPRVVRRCAELGITADVASKLSKSDIFAAGDPRGLLMLLDLDFDTLEPIQRRRPKRWLWMAAQTASVSFRRVMTENELLKVLSGFEYEEELFPHVDCFLNEAPACMVIMAVQETAARTGEPVQKVWNNVKQAANRCGGKNSKIWELV